MEPFKWCLKCEYFTHNKQINNIYMTSKTEEYLNIKNFKIIDFFGFGLKRFMRAVKLNDS